MAQHQRPVVVVSKSALIPSTTRANHGLKRTPTQLPNRPPQSTITSPPPSSPPLPLHPAAHHLLLTPNLQSLPSLPQSRRNPPTYPLHHSSTRPQQPSISAAAWTKPHHRAIHLLPVARDWERYPRDAGTCPLITRKLNASTLRLL